LKNTSEDLTILNFKGKKEEGDLRKNKQKPNKEVNSLTIDSMRMLQCKNKNKWSVENLTNKCLTLLKLAA
jgi:hypothetical protein